MATHARVTIPATTANLGPGFDCLGLALGLFNTLEVWAFAPDDPLPAGIEAGDRQPAVSIGIVGEGSGQLAEDERNLILHSVMRVYEEVGAPLPALCARATNGIPLGYGLGSSAAAVVGGVAGANALLGGPLSRLDLLRLAFEIEGHPDNAAPALFGGLVIVSATADGLLTQPVDTPPMQVAIARPDFPLPTAEARAVLPKSVPMADAVFNIGRTALVVNALQRGDYGLLGRALDDRLHQPYRKGLIPGYDEAVQAALAAGAAAAALSGAGPSLIAFAPANHESIAQAMAGGFQKAGVAARTFVLPVDRQGVRVTVAGSA